MTEFTLNKNTKYDVQIGDIIAFNYGDTYTVTNIIELRIGLNYTIQNIKTKQTIYSYPSSYCYGAKVRRNNE